MYPRVIILKSVIINSKLLKKDFFIIYITTKTLKIRPSPLNYLPF